MLQQNSLALEAQLEERPLAKKQEALSEGEPPRERHHHDHHANKHEPVHDDSVKAQDRSTTPKPEKHLRKALLKNDDFELQRIAKVRTETFHIQCSMTDVSFKLLDEVHDRFFSAYDTVGKQKPVYRVDKPPYDVTVSFFTLFILPIN